MIENNAVAKKENVAVDTPRDLQIVNPLVDIFENDDEILLVADMPGVAREDIAVHLDNGNLELSGKRRLGATGAVTWEEFDNVEYRRSFSVPQTIDVDKVKAETRDGVLTLHLVKTEAAKPRMIEVQVA